jgi:xanthine/CO dehydrogenase XdhC/CoxF family maturation factor
MLEMREILKRVAAEGGSDAILATLVDVQGSGYRLVGARMLIGRDGKSIGTVSGGCLEADILERAKEVLRTGEPTVVSYDTTKDDNSVFGLSMGCRGVVRVLLEPARNNEALEFINDCFERRERGAITTLISGRRGAGIAIASRLFISASGEIISGNEAAMLNGFLNNVSSDAALALEENRSRSRTYETAQGTAEFFHEVVNPPTSIVIFGAGHDAVPLVRAAAQLGWQIAVIDHRPAWAVKERFADTDEIIVSRPEDIPPRVFDDIESVAVVMNHNYEIDREVLRRLLGSSFRYIGVLGPRQRTEQLLDEIREQGTTISKEQFEKLYAPVGLDIGASTPEAIALSIVAEIQAVLSGRDGRSLKYRQAAIYDR